VIYLSQNKKKVFGLLIVSIIIAFFFTGTIQSFVSFPNEIRMFESASKQLNISLPISTTVSSSDTNVAKVDGDKNLKYDSLDSFTVESIQQGESKLTIKLFGLIPFKSVNVNVIKDVKVIPGGQTIGVKLNSAGIMVVGHHSIGTNSKDAISPSESAGIRIGDVIIKMNGERVSTVNDVVNKVNKNGNKKIEFELLRDNEKIKLEVTPMLDQDINSYRLGLYIRDSAAGVGTLTFYDPVTNKYGALGHVITDSDTQRPILVGDGKILSSDVTSIDKGESGKPGGKKAIFTDEGTVIGDITKNTPFGIFGKILSKPKNGISNEPIYIALPEEVVEGPAEILTVIQGQKVEKFDIEIVNVINQSYPATKGMVIKVTDPRLLEKTGGIIQGMSGSPIIQNGKLVGAVTHVFVNDPTSGYGSYIEWMIRDADILQGENNSKNLKAS